MDDRGYEHSTKKLADIVGVSRSTLRHYEKIGLICPDRRKGSSYRVFDNGDLNRVVEFFILRGSGTPTDEAVEFCDDEELGIADCLAACKRGNAAQRVWCDAVGRELDRLGRLYGTHLDGKPFVCRVPNYCFFGNQASPGGKISDPDAARSALFRGAPLASTACLMDSWQESSGHLWGNAVPAYMTYLIPELKESRAESVLFEGGPCVCVCVRLPYALNGRLGELKEEGEKIAQYCDARRFEMRLPCLLADYVPAGRHVHATMYVPVAGKDVLARGWLSCAAHHDPWAEARG